MNDVRASMAEALRRHRAGDLDGAESIYHDVLAGTPDQPVAHHYLGVIRHQRGDHAGAVERIRRALELDPRDAAAHTNLGSALQGLQRFEEAAAAHQEALRLQPGDAIAHHNLANTLARLGRLEEAVGHYGQAVRRNERDAAAHTHLGHALVRLRRFAEAASSYRAALALQPRHGAALRGLGRALFGMGRLADAALCCQDALAVDPEDTAAYRALGEISAELGLRDEAVRCLQRALQSEPDDADLHHRLGRALAEQGRLDEAAASMRWATQLQPEAFGHQVRLGSILEMQGRAEEAASCIRRAAILAPASPWWTLREARLFPDVAPDRAAIEAGRRRLAMALERQRRVSPAFDADELAGANVFPPLRLIYHGLDNRALKEAYAAVFRSGMPPGEPPKRASGAIRVGMLVTRNHEGSFLRCMGGIVPGLAEAAGIEPVLLCSRAGEQRLRADLDERACRIVLLAGGLGDVAACVRAEALDVLYYWEVGTDALNYHLPFLRLAPVQCTGWGVNDTSGIDTVDAFISSDLVEDTGAERHYTERLHRARGLPTWQVRPPEPDRSEGRRALGVEGHIHLCGQRLAKCHPDFDAVLAGILGRDPEAVVVLLEDRHGYAADALRARLAAPLGGLFDRIHFLPHQPYDRYLALVAAADVILDTPHCGGGMTCYDAFALGKALVTWPSPLARGRYALACYRRMGLDACVAPDLESYVDIAVGLGRDPERRRHVEEAIREASDVLFEDRAAITEHARLFREMAEGART